MTVDLCPTCGDTLDDVEFCIVATCPHKQQAGHGARSVASGGGGAAGAVALPRADLARRLGGSGLEFLTLFGLEVVGAIFVPVGILLSLLAAAYFAVKDLQGGRYSFGKRIASTRVVDVDTGQVPSAGRLVLRNSYLVAGWVLSIVPGFEIFGWALLLFSALVDALMVIADPRGRRLGDRLARTQVVPVEQA